ncbi:MAG: tRNA (guanosine(46)-N7)-methyltransferase TrmB [Spirochaetia bacterium]
MNSMGTHIRSYVSRAGNTTKGQKVALQELGHKWTIPYAPKLLDYAQYFSRCEQVVLEIGFGAGDATAQLAQTHTHTGYLGVEVYASGVGALLMKIEEKKLENLRIIQHDAVEVLTGMIMDESLDGVHVFFPDPWPKKRHHKRRLLQASIIQKIAQKLRVGGYFYMTTDWQEYAQEVLERVSAEVLFYNPHAGFSPTQVWRPKTRFQKKGEAASREIFEIYVVRCEKKTLDLDFCDLNSIKS